MSSAKALQAWIIQALESSGGKASLLYVAEHIWNHHRNELEADKELFFTWQYRMRWAATELRKRGKLKPVEEAEQRAWELA